ncbi:meiotic nuclear division protein 1 [Acrasis kona]|uniref:Meiotic nuclear division protein 1 n=1 Tax=Acrasis kona TaxID=1008807 RepID=A0AAW2ZE85_9EUKA
MTLQIGLIKSNHIFTRIQMNVGTSIIGRWIGPAIGSVPFDAEFHADGRVRFVGEEGTYDLIFTPNNKPVLKMTFLKKNNNPHPHVTTNSFQLNESTLILETDRGLLKLMRDCNNYPDVEPYQAIKPSVVRNVNDQTNRAVPKYTYNTTATNIDSYIPHTSVDRSSPSNQNILRQGFTPQKQYFSEELGLYFTTPPTWFFSINEHLPVILSCVSPGIIFARTHRPQTEDNIRERYKNGYSEKHLIFSPLWPEMITIREDGSRNRQIVLIGDYIERTSDLRATVTSIGSTFGDYVSIFGVVNGPASNFDALKLAILEIADTVCFYQPKALNSYASLPGKYISFDNKSTLLINPNSHFTWTKEGVVESGKWDRMGNHLEGELIFVSNRTNLKWRTRFVVVDPINSVFRLDDTMYKRSV